MPSAQLLSAAAAVIIYIIATSSISVPEGYVAVVYRFGSLRNSTLRPGLHFNIPFVDKSSLVLVRPQTDVVRDVHCATSDGVNTFFAGIDVGNTLTASSVIDVVHRFGEDYDQYLVMAKIRHRMNEICSTMSSDDVFIKRFDEVDDLLFNFLRDQQVKLKSPLIIDFVRLAKPTLPHDLQQRYNEIAEQKAALKVEFEKQARVFKEEETARGVLVKRAETQRQVHELQNQQDLERIRHEKVVENLRNEMLIAARKAEADAASYAAEAETAVARERMAIPGWGDLERARAYAANAKVFAPTGATLVFAEGGGVVLGKGKGEGGAGGKAEGG
jgi:erlin